MRKFLLASAATVGATVGLVGVASAQPAAAPMPMGVMNMPSQPMPYLGGNNSNNADGGPLANAMTSPTPGSVVIHLNGRIWFYGSFQGGSGYTRTTPGTPAATTFAVNPATGAIVSTTTAATPASTNKLAPFGLIGYARLYPGMDGLATNGLRYGGIMEIRQNFGTVGTGPGSAVGANSSGASGQSSASTLYFRRQAVYIGSDNIGIFRLGEDDGPISQFDGGVTTFQNFGVSNWNGDGPDLQLGNINPTWPFWSGIGNEYDIAKIVYLSPNFYGFDFGLSYAPNNNGAVAQTGCSTGVASTGCATLSTSSLQSDSWRATNMYNVQARYRGNFSGFGIYATGGYVGSGHVHSSVGPDLANGFSVGDAGIALTYAGFTVGGHTIFGQFNGQVGLQPKGAPNAVAWIAGLQYASGPFTIGTSWFNYQSQGAVGLTGISQRFENGFDLSGSYSIAPGLVAYAGYSYGQRHQGGVDFIAGTGCTTTAGVTACSPNNNTVHTNNFLIGTRVQW